MKTILFSAFFLLVFSCKLYAAEFPEPQWKIMFLVPDIFIMGRNNTTLSQKEMREFKFLCGYIREGSSDESKYRYKSCQDVISKKGRSIDSRLLNIALDICYELENSESYSLCKRFG